MSSIRINTYQLIKSFDELGDAEFVEMVRKHKDIIRTDRILVGHVSERLKEISLVMGILASCGHTSEEIAGYLK